MFWFFIFIRVVLNRFAPKYKIYLGVFFMSNCSIAIQILPLSSSEQNTLKVVDEVIAYIQSRTDYFFVSSFETTIEGDYDECMDIIKGVIEIAGKQHPEIFANIKVRYKAEGQVLSTDEKTAKFRK